MFCYLAFLCFLSGSSLLCSQPLLCHLRQSIIYFLVCRGITSSGFIIINMFPNPISTLSSFASLAILAWTSRMHHILSYHIISYPLRPYPSCATQYPALPCLTASCPPQVQFNSVRFSSVRTIIRARPIKDREVNRIESPESPESPRSDCQDVAERERERERERYVRT